MSCPNWVASCQTHINDSLHMMRVDTHKQLHWELNTHTSALSATHACQLYTSADSMPHHHIHLHQTSTSADTGILICHCRSRTYARWPSFSSPAYIPQQHQSQPNDSLLQCTLAHARAAAAAGQECLLELVQRVQGRQQPGEQQPVRRPGENVPFGMLKLTLHDVELTTPGLCFCVLRIGPHWGRSSTLTASPKAAWDWEVTLTCYAVA